jgi:hypothetical protein
LSRSEVGKSSDKDEREGELHWNEESAPRMKHPGVANPARADTVLGGRCYANPSIFDQ